MLFSKDKWIATFKAVVEKTKADPSSGQACAIATVKLISDGLCDDIGDKSDDDKALCATVRECLQELVGQIRKGEKLAGFGSNASAAAGAAGFKVGKKSALGEFEL